MNRSPKRLARKLIVLSLALTGLIISLIALPGLRRSAASSADATRTAMAQPDRQIAGAPFIQGVNASRRSMMRTDFGLARRERGILLPALRARAAAAMTGSPFAPVIAATLSDALQTDNNNSGKADPGDTLMYTVTITNSGSDATGVTYTQDLSQNGGNLTLVPGSVNSSPVAVNDSYPNGVGNTRMSVNAANGVLANDFDPDGTTPTAVPITNGNTTNGGKVTLLADGSFTYDPPVGFTGTDTFTYQATDGSKMDNGTVSITLTERVWYVDSNASVDGDGRSATPFKVITGHLDGAGGGGDVDAANDYIFLYSGSYSVTTLPLESGERLIGQGVNLVVNSQTLVTASTKPTLTGTGTAVTLSTGNTVSGLDVSGTSGITGSSVGALTISTVGATGTNGPAFDVQTAGAISVQFDSLSSSGGGIGVRLTSPTSGTFTVTGTTTVNKTSGTGDGITITGGGATTTFTGAVSVTTFNGKGIVANAAGGITISSNSSMVDATGGAALDLTSQNLGSGWNFNLLKSTNSAAEGIKMQGCIQNLTATTTNIQTPTGNGIDIQSTVAPATLSFGTTTVNKTAAGTGINLVGNGTATVSFGALTLTSGNGSGLVATTSGTVNVSSGTITSTSGPALNLSSVTAGVTLTSASSTNSSATGINLATVAGSVSIGTTTVTNSTGIGINATSNSATLGFGGTTVNGSSGTGIVLGTSGNGNTGTITFGALNIAPDNNARGLQAVDNSNTITVTSGTISTAGSPASSGNPAIEITRGSGTTPLTVSLTSVSANGSSTAGIILTNTNGSFTITGDGGSANNSSGGTIQSTSRSGIELSNVQNVSFDQMNLQSTSRSGVNGTSVTNFTFTNSTINNAGSQNRDACIAFNTTTFTGVQTQNGNNINGTMTITGCTMTNGFLAGVDIECDNGTITNANVSNNTINNPGSGGAGTAGLSFVGKGTASTTGNLDKATINLNNITGAGGAGIQIAYSNSDTSPGATAGIPNDATNIIAITNNGISLDSTGTNAIVVTVMSSNSTSRSRSNFNIQGNGKTAANGGTAPAALGSSSQGTVILLGSNGFTDMTGTVNDNRITSSQTANLGGGNGIGAGTGVGANVSGGWTPTLTLIVTNNVITGTDGNGILLVARSGNVGTTHGIAKFKVASNNVSAPINLGGTARQGISVQAGNASSDDDEVYLNINSNTSAGSNAASGIGVRKQGSVQTVNDFGIYDAAGGPALANCPNPSNTDVQTFINALNPAGNGTDVNGGPGYACDTTMAPASVTPIEQSAGGEFTPSSAATSDAANEVDRNGQLKAHHGEVAPGNDVRQLTMAEAVWMGQQAIHRWQNLGLSAEDMARLNGVTFEVSDLPAGQIADLRGTTIVVDEIAAGYGWYVDQNPYDDSEFDVPVFDRERQTTEYSAAHGKMDLLTVLMRELGSVYLQGKNKTPKKLRPLMNPLLLPGVRRMPTDQWNVSLPSPVGAMQSPAKANVQASASAPAPAAVAQNRQPATAQVEGQRAEAPTAPARTTEYAAAARYAVFRRATNQPAEAGSLRHAVTRPQDVAVMGIHEDSFDSEEMPTLRPAAMTMQKAKGQKTFVPNAVQSGGIVSVGPFNLPANESVTIMFQATIDTPVVPAGTTSVCSQGKVTYSGGPAGGVLTTDPGPPAVNGPTCTTLAQADLAVTKSDSPDPVTTGNNITYTINLINNGPDAAYNVKVTDATPANTTFVSATPPAGWAVTSSPSVGGTGNIVFEKSPAGPVANGGMAQFTVVVQVDPATAGGTVITNNAVATSDTPDGTPANNTGTTTTTAQAQADLALTKSDSPDPVIAGNNITYTINFVNNGPGTAQTVTVTDAVPANTTFVSAVVTTGSGWTIPSPPSVGGTGNVVFSKASVPSGETAVFTIVVKVNANTANGATINNSAVAASTTTDPTPGNNTATAMTTVQTQADLAVTKTDSPDPVIAGNNITYTINFVNNGPSDAQTVTVTDAVPANTTFVSAVVTTGSGWTIPSPPSVGGTGNVVFSKASVAAGETAVFTIVVKVNSNVASGITITNTATAATTTTDPTSSNDTATATTTTQTAADLVVTKTDSPDPVNAGSNITYTINFSNAGPSDAQNVTVTDAVPANTTFVSAVVTTGSGWTMPSPPSVGGTGNVVFSKVSVVAGESAVFTMVVKVNSNTASGTTISNSAVAASTTNDAVPANNTGTATTTVQTRADLAITKSDSPDPSFAGNNITYTINFTNNGPSDAASVTVTDAVPTNTTFVSATVTTGSGWTIPSPPAVGGTGNVVFSKDPVAAGETAVFTIVVKVDASTPTGTTITNTATAATTTTDPDSSNNTATATTDIQAQADLTIDKTGLPSPDVVAGNNMTYTINFTNNGPGAATSVTVTDPTPANTTFVSATVTTGSGWTMPSPPSVGGTGTVTFSKATVANGETAVFTIVVKVNSSTPNNTTITNTATAASTTADPNTNDNTDAFMVNAIRQVDLYLTKTASPTPNVIAGNDITYTINFTNNGPSDASNVTVTDAVPAGTSLVSAMVTTGSGWSTNTSGPIVFSKSAVTAGETAVFTIVVHVPSSTANGTNITNTATAAATETDTDPITNTASASISVITRADLAVTKTDSPDPVIAGNNLTYTINFSNAGPSDAQTVTVSDAVPANTSFVSAVVTTGTGWSVNTSGPIVFSKATVAGGETAVFTIVVKVNANTANGTVISNSATAATTTTDPTAGNNTDTATTTVQTQADLAVTKTDTPDPAFAGGNITYTINFSNNGPSDAQTVTVTDAVPSNTTFVSAVVTTGSGWTIPSPPSVGGTGTVTFSKSTVAASETAVFTIVVKVDANTASGTVISNSATAATTTTDPTAGNNTGTATTTIQTEADLAVTKSDSPDPVIAGNNLTYTINFVNNGPSDAQTVTVTDAVPANTTFVSAVVTTGSGWTIPSPPSVGGTGNVVFSKATVTNGETAVFTIVVKVNANTANGATISNSAVAAATTGDGNSANNTAMATTTVQTQADLAVTKSDSPDPVIAGNDLTYTINFVNNGPSDAQSVTVSDAVPANTSFVSAVVTTGTGWSVNTSGPIVFSKATVAAGETAVFTIVVKVNANTANGTVISNSATAATTTTDPTAGNNTSTATTTVQTQADLAVTKTDTPDPVFAGNNITYTINFVNNGPSDAQTVTVTDPIPANTTFVSAVVTTGTGWSVNAPPPGSRPGKGVPTPTGNVVFSKSTVAASETAVFTIVVKVNSSAANGSTITNTATAASTTTDPTAGNNSATAMTTVQTQADLALTKTDSPDPVVASQNLTYTLTLNNNGPSDAQTVSVSDAVPANTTFVSATVTTGSGWSTSQPSVGGTGTVTFSKATMAGGETAVFTIVVNVNSGTANNTVITNTATATTATTDPTPVNNTATATTTVIAQADLAVTKSDSPDPVCVNGNLTYTINFVDNGPGPGLNTTVTDAVPVNTTFVSATVTTGSGWSTSQPSAGGTGNVVFSKANVANGETAVFTIVVKVNAGVLHGTVITNSVTAASSIPDPTPGNNTAMTTTTVDPIAPTITCPANITSMAQLSCPNTTTAVVNFAPTVTDNCAATYVCSPASGSAFPVGTTTVSCTATDTAGNTASCSFTVKVWSACLQDESNPGNVVLFNSQTGEYQFCCNGVVTATGTGTVSVRGCVVQFDHIKGNRKVNIRADLSQMRGTATVIIANQSTCVITDMNMANNSCQCPTGVKP